MCLNINKHILKTKLRFILLGHELSNFNFIHIYI